MNNQNSLNLQKVSSISSDIELQQKVLLDLPSYPVILIWLSAIVLVATLLFGLMGYLLPCALPMVFVTILAPTISLLQRVDDVRMQHVAYHDTNLQPLMNYVSSLAGMKRAPKIYVSNQDIALQVIGGLRRQMVLIGKPLLEQLIKMGNAPNSESGYLEILLFHELQHIVQKDILYLEILRQLFKKVSIWALWTTALALGMLMMLQAIGLQATSLIVVLLTAGNVPVGQELLAEAARRVFTGPVTTLLVEIPMLFPDINFLLPLTAIVVSLIPFGLTALTLFILWYSALRVRELYADVATSMTYGTNVWMQVLIRANISSRYEAQSADKETLVEKLSKLTKPIRLAAHPTGKMRREAIRKPVQLITNPINNGILIGVLALAMSILTLGGFGTVFGKSWPIHVPSIAVFWGTALLSFPRLLAYQFRLSAARTIGSVFIAGPIAFSGLFMLSRLVSYFAQARPDETNALLVSTCRAVSGQIFSNQISTCDPSAIQAHFQWLGLVSIIGFLCTVLIVCVFLVLSRQLELGTLTLARKQDLLQSNLILSLGALLILLTFITGTSKLINFETNALSLLVIGSLIFAIGLWKRAQTQSSE